MTTTSSSAPTLSVVLGGTGGIGGALVRELARRGQRVRAVSRSGALPDGLQSSDHVEGLAADMRDPAEVERVASGATVVYQATQPAYTNWPMEFPVLTRAVLQGVASTGAKLVVADNLYMYGPVHGVEMTENMPYDATDRKGRTRAAMASELLGAHDAGLLRVALGRASSYYGPGGTATMYGAQIFGPALAGAPAQWIGPLDVPRTFSYLPDIARGLIVLGESDQADGKAWHLPHAGVLTGADFLRLVYAAAGSLNAGSDTDGYLAQGADKDTLPYIAAANPAIAGFLTEIDDIWFHLEEPYIVNTTAFERTFGEIALTPHRQAVGDTLSWFSHVTTEPI